MLITLLVTARTKTLSNEHVPQFGASEIYVSSFSVEVLNKGNQVIT